MNTQNKRPAFNYDPKKLDRELKPFYLSASEKDVKEMLDYLDLKSLDDLYAHIPDEIKFDSKESMKLGKALGYEELATHLYEISQKNKEKTSFLGGALQDYKQPAIVDHVSNLRNLATAYTPYQPERSQGTLESLWLYQSLLASITGFEAINASFYDRSTCLFEALNCATRLAKNKNTVLVSEAIYESDLEVIKTLAVETDLKLVFVPVNAVNGQTDQAKVQTLFEEHQNDVAGLAFPQITKWGLLDDVHFLTDFCQKKNIKSIGVIDPILLASTEGGLVPPSEWGADKKGVTMIVAEGQHLAIAPNFGGPGLGVFGIRFNDQDKISIRQTAGRYIGKAQDAKGRPCKCMVLSTREQHIRRDKATSNICSNEGFIATLAGAALLERGAKGLQELPRLVHTMARAAAIKLSAFEGVRLAYPGRAFLNEILLELDMDVDALIAKASEHNLHVGTKIAKNRILISFSDRHTSQEVEDLELFFESVFKRKTNPEKLEIGAIPQKYLRHSQCVLPDISSEELKSYYEKLSEQNIGPDNAIYPLGSCTMKYNPYINEYAANLPGFTNAHPHAPLADVQGSLEILYEVQEMLKRITNLPAITTQPLAGAQGELAGIKMFQAYHRDHGEGDTRNILLITSTAHGTNPATASMAGIKHLEIIPAIKEGPKAGLLDLDFLKQVIDKHGKSIIGIMVTNPNTSGLFEVNFKEMSDMIHAVGGLVYMDGANMNAIAGWIDLNKMGVDAVHNNLHKTWSIPHGGGGPGDAIVAGSARLAPYMIGYQVVKTGSTYSLARTDKSIGDFHRHLGNFAHKIRCYTYLKALGDEGVRKMSALAVLSSRYLYKKISSTYPSLPEGADHQARMHEFILTLSKETFEHIEKSGTAKANIIARVGKLFLDFGLHAPTVAFPEVYGLMVEPTESYSKAELDHFADVVKEIHHLITEHPEVLLTTPHFTPVDKVDEVKANLNLVLSENIKELALPLRNRAAPEELLKMPVKEISKSILQAHKNQI